MSDIFPIAEPKAAIVAAVERGRGPGTDPVEQTRPVPPRAETRFRRDWKKQPQDFPTAPMRRPRQLGRTHPEPRPGTGRAKAGEIEGKVFQRCAGLDPSATVKRSG